MEKKDFKELNLSELDKIAGGQGFPPVLDLLSAEEDPSDWAGAILGSARERKRALGISLDQAIADIERSYAEYGMQILHLREFLTPRWDSL